MDTEYLLAHLSETDSKPKKLLGKFRQRDETKFEDKPKKRSGKDRKGRSGYNMYSQNDTE